MKAIEVTLEEQTIESPKTIELKEGAVIKTLSVGSHVFMLVTKPRDVVGRIPGIEDGKHAEAAIAAYVPTEDEVIVNTSKVDGVIEKLKMIYADKIVEHKTTIQHVIGQVIWYFVLAEYKENHNKTYSLKDGSKWIEVELL